MEDMEKAVKSISCEGLIWGQCKYFYIRGNWAKNEHFFFSAKFVPLAYGIKKLQIGCVIEDDKVSVDWLTEEIQNFEDLVQSVDIAAFNKI
jgi:translation elongation factor EF-1beta